MEFLVMRNVRWNQRLPNSFDIAEWYGSALALAEAGLTEEFLAVREAAAREAVRDAEEERMRQIAALDRRIDAAVYGLYGLTAEEIKVVEESK
jgi:hypothetical protein